MQSQFYTTLLLTFAIQLDYFILHADAEDLKKPEIGVQNSGGEVDLACHTMLKHLPSGTNVTCNLYIGDSSQPFRSTWTKHKDKVCIFIVKRDDLKQGLQSVGTTEVSCDYSVPTDPRSPSSRSDKRKIEGKLPTVEFQLSPAVISIEESVNLRCRRPDSAPASHCTFIINQRGPISGSDCNRSVTGAELLSGSHSARNEIIMRCFYSLEEGGKPARHSDPSTVTVLDLRKPNISVSTEHTETHICCEAPPDITGAIFFLYYNRSNTDTNSTQAGTEERAVSFTVPRSSDSTLTYCCRYQFKGINSKLSYCAEAKNKDQSGRTKDQKSARLLWRHILSALVVLAAIGILIEYFISHTPTTVEHFTGGEHTVHFYHVQLQMLQAGRGEGMRTLGSLWRHCAET
ncbi:uncharacterized protein LOC135247274 isoform X2 [Anguilla rostrata]|uniref:uncharacterized protein LOC135247274 isoform X2 n=1 Tax=Anguilla rostrata TaxID=7938 RepID=UPI0030D1982D